MGTDYVEARDGNLYIGKSRVTLDTVVIRWQMGDSPEVILDILPRHTCRGCPSVTGAVPASPQRARPSFHPSGSYRFSTGVDR